jgi:hypothetical protein
MARSLRQLWADEDEAQVREPDRKRRAARLHAAQAGRLRRPVVAKGQHRATRHRT